MLDIRRLLDRYNVRWRDRGKNVSHNNLVIGCVFCNKTVNKDPGEHLSINYSTGECYCYRNSRHAGYITKVFFALGIPPSEFQELLKDGIKQVKQEAVKVDRNYLLFNDFQPAETSEEALTYLQSRLFTRPVDICKKFNLKVDSFGRWAGRLIIPLTEGWTGRSMRNHIEPRYLAYTSEDGFFLYRQKSTSCIIVEGSVDAMKIASVSTQFDIIAKCKIGLSSAILSYLAGAHYMSILNTPDAGVDFQQYFEEQKVLRSYFPYATVKRVKLPEKVKDFGAMTEHHTREFLLKRVYA